MGKHEWHWKPPAKAVAVRETPQTRARDADFARETAREGSEMAWAWRRDFDRVCPICSEMLTERVPGVVGQWRCRRRECGVVWTVARSVENLP